MGKGGGLLCRVFDAAVVGPVVAYCEHTELIPSLFLSSVESLKEKI